MDNSERKFKVYSIYDLRRIAIKNQKDKDILNDILIELHLYRKQNTINTILINDIKKFKELYRVKIKEIFLNDYIPKNRGEQDEFSKQILKFKDGNENSIKYFEDQIFKRWKHINENKFSLCKVPSSDKNKINNTISELIKRIIARSSEKHRDASDFIIRKYSIKPQHKSYRNERLSIASHLDSLDICKSKIDLIEGKNIILFDDVLTTGNSMKSSSHLLFKHKAQNVIQFTLSKTKQN